VSGREEEGPWLASIGEKFLKLSGAGASRQTSAAGSRDPRLGACAGLRPGDIASLAAVNFRTGLRQLLKEKIAPQCEKALGISSTSR